MSGHLTGKLGANSVLLNTTGTAGTDTSNNGYSSGSFGSITTAVWKDRSGTNRTINFLIWGNGASVQIWANVPSVPNTNITFESITISGPGGNKRLRRADASYNGAQSGGLYSSWSWADTTNFANSTQAYRLIIS